MSPGQGATEAHEPASLPPKGARVTALAQPALGETLGSSSSSSEHGSDSPDLNTQPNALLEKEKARTSRQRLGRLHR